ncbi:MAG TPA: metal ABC transporter permease [Candidatus Thermoplasmatota archaeon]|nr:metal ABC transporter permease [Candidatus Thermoplasmatota archaeon]
MDIIHYVFFQRALIAGVLAALACGMIGVYVVVRRSVFLADGISHAAFGGIGIAVYLGWSQPLFGALLASLVMAAGVGIAGIRTRLREDSVIGILWVLGMALGFVFLYRAPPEHLLGISVNSLFFGNILYIRESDLYLMAILCAVIIIVVTLLYKELLALSFDEEFARISGVRTGMLSIILLGLIALTVVLLINVVGVILVVALLAIPAAMAGLFTYDMRRMMMLAVLLGIVFCIGGLFISDAYDLPSGATIVLLAGTGFCLSFVGKKIWTHTVIYRAKATDSSGKMDSS